MRNFFILTIFSGLLLLAYALQAQPCTISISAFPKKICNKDSATLIAFGADSYTWTPSTTATLKDGVVRVAPGTTTTYTITATPNGCSQQQASITIVVNQLPTATISGPNYVCQNIDNSSITFTANGGTGPYTFGYNIVSFDTTDIETIGPNQTIETKETENTSTLIIPTIDGKLDTLKYYLVNVSDRNCTLENLNLNKTVELKTPPLNPAFTSKNGIIFQDTLKVCAGTNNINFSVNIQRENIEYKWTNVIPDNRNLDTLKNVFIRASSKPNAIISFGGTSRGRINVVATDTRTQCTSSVSQYVIVSSKPGFAERSIFEKKPGNLLIYPDHSLHKYQWGYDTIVNSVPDTIFGPPVVVSNQDYQFFIPTQDPRLIFTRDTGKGPFLDTTNRRFWVMLENWEGCESRVYYNGLLGHNQSELVSISNPVELQVFPNPNQGNFDISLKGNIYGNIQATIYNSLGQKVFTKRFIKTNPEMYEKFNTGKLSSGIYFLELNSSDLKKVVTRFIIQH